MELSLGVFERLVLLNILPAQGDYKSMKQVRELKEELAFSDEELGNLKFDDKTKPGEMLWIKEFDIPKKISFGSAVREIIADRLRELDKDKKLREAHVPLFETFVLGVNHDEDKDSQEPRTKPPGRRNHSHGSKGLRPV